MNDQEYREHVISTLSENSATLKAVKENLERSISYFVSNDLRIEKESRERDDAAAEKIQGLREKIGYFAGAGTLAGTGLGLTIKYFLAKLGIHGS